MNNSDIQNQDFAVDGPQSQSFDIKAVFSRNVIYWPLLLILVTLGAASAWTYLRYTPKIYGASSKVSVKRESPLGNNSTSINISLGGQQNMMEKEILLLSSNQVYEEVARKLKLYSEVIGKGSVVTQTLYGSMAPLKLQLDKPDFIDNPGIFPIEIDWKSNSVKLGEKVYPFDTPVSTPFGKGVFLKNPSSEGKPYDNLFLSVKSISQCIAMIRGGLSTTTNPRQGDILNIQYYDLIPQRAIDVLDSIVPVYDEYSLADKKKSLLNSYRFINERLQVVEGELSSVEQNISDFKSSNLLVGDGSEDGANAKAGMEEADAKIQEIDLEIAKVNRAQSLISSSINSDNLQTLAALGDVGVSDQIGQLMKAEEELNRLRQISGPENPKVLALERQISRLRPAIQEGAKNFKSNLMATRESVLRQKGMYSGRLSVSPQKEKAFLDISRQQSIKNQIYSYLLEKREENVISMAGLVGSSQFIHRPSSMGLISPVPSFIYAYFLLGAIGLFVAFIVLKELMNQTYQDRSEIENQIQAPILGELMEYVKSKEEENETIFINPLRFSVIGEQFREVRTNLMYMGLGGENKTILVTSSMPGEGKTTVAINIAASLSSTGKKVALLGFDMRKGKMGERCGVSTNPGLSNYLIGQASLAKISYKMEGFPNLDVLPEGLRPPNPAELILTDRMEKLMQEMKFHYDFIVIDSPPVGSVSDAKLIAKYAYATLFIVRHQYTPRYFFASIKDFYTSKKLPNLAIVLNGIKKYSFMGFSSGNGHQSGYGYGYGYGYVDSNISKKKSKQEEPTVG